VVGVDQPLAEWEQELMVSSDPVSGRTASGSTAVSDGTAAREPESRQAETMVITNGVPQT
jgi:hypothetical protein